MIKQILKAYVQLCIVLTVSSVAGQTIYVDSAAVGANNGGSWQNAYTSLTEALLASTAGSTIYVARGTYRPDSSRSFVLNSGVKMYGGFESGQSSISQRNINLNKTILKGYGNSVVTINNADSTTVLDGFTISDGQGKTGIGGGILNYASSPLITNCIFTNNTATEFTGAGGAIFTYGNSNSRIINCYFENNVALRYGGAIGSQDDGPALILNCVFKGNSTEVNGIPDDYADLGGAVGGIGVTHPVKLVNCLFSGNRSYEGGAVGYRGMVADGKVDFINCTFAGNLSTSSSFPLDDSPPLSISYGVPSTFSNCLFWGNSGSASKPIQYYQFTPEPVLTNCITTIDPLFNNLVSYSLAPTTDGDYSLQINSPAIDAGDNSWYDITAFGDKDPFGNARFINNSIDIGAYEFDATLLPVTFGAISAEIVQNKLSVNWSTETEMNNDHFDIEVSADGKLFYQIATIRSKAVAGNSSGTLQYNYEVGIGEISFAVFGLGVCMFLFRIKRKKQNIFILSCILGIGIFIHSCSKKEMPVSMNNETLYLRIAQTDKDGKKTYSKVITPVKK